MRVLLVTKPLSPPWNDSGKLVPRDLARAAGERHEWHVLGSRGAAVAWPRGVVAHPLYHRAGGFRLGALERLGLMAGVWRLRAHFDALHFFFQPHPAASAAARALTRLCGRPALHTVLSAPQPGAPPGRLMFARRVVTLSADTARRIASACSTPPRVIPPGLADLDPVPPARVEAVRAATALPTGFLLYPGDYEFSGGHETLLAAWAAAPDLPPLAFAGRDKTRGAGLARARLEARARELGLGARVRFLGTVPDMEALIASSGAVLFPARSLYGKTDLPLVLLEAWRERRAVLVSGLPPLLEATTGLDARVDDAPEAWAAAARRLGAEALARGAAGRERLLGCYTARQAVAAYEALYDEVDAELQAGSVAP